MGHCFFLKHSPCRFTYRQTYPSRLFTEMIFIAIFTAKSSLMSLLSFILGLFAKKVFRHLLIFVRAKKGLPIDLC
jgi:hypothetical protein